MSGFLTNRARLLVVLGPTASGKTDLSVQLAATLEGEILSADSRQVYMGMDIGTGKDLHSYGAGDRSIPYHLIDIVPAGTKYNVARFTNDFYTAFGDIAIRNKLPILCGGTGMYIQNVLQEQPYTAVPVNAALRTELETVSKDLLLKRLHAYPNTAYADISSVKRIIRAIEVAAYTAQNPLSYVSRPAIYPLVIGVDLPRDISRKRILARLNARMAGLEKEVKSLVEQGVGYDTLVYYGLEYKFMTNYIAGKLDYATMHERLYTGICQFAKRQMTYFRKMEKDGIKIHWVDGTMEKRHLYENVLNIVKDA